MGTKRVSNSATYVIEDVLKQKLEDKELDIPVLPEVASKILSLTRNPDAEVGDLSDLIHKDQSLAGYVLKVANSSAYCGSERIVSLKQAISRLGMQLLGSIALAITLQDKTFSGGVFQKYSRQIFMHALASGTYTREIARMKRKNVEGLFLCGILHTIGKPVVLKLITQYAKENNVEVALPDAQKLVEHYHIPVGGVVAENWQLPQVVTAAIAHSSDYSKATQFHDEIRMTYLGGLLGSWVIDSKNIDEDSVRSDPVMVELNFYPDDVNQLLECKSDVKATIQSLS